jgi:hypothetical protein
VGSVHTGSTRHAGHFWPIVPAPGDCEDGEFGGMKIVWGNRSTRRKHAPAPLCAPQIPFDQTRARTRAAAVKNQRLTAWAMERPSQRKNIHLTAMKKKYLVVHRRNNECRWKFCNVAIGVLKNDQALPKKSFPLSHQDMSAVNHATARVSSEAIQTLRQDAMCYSYRRRTVR